MTPNQAIELLKHGRAITKVERGEMIDCIKELMTVRKRFVSQVPTDTETVKNQVLQNSGPIPSAAQTLLGSNSEKIV